MTRPPKAPHAVRPDAVLTRELSRVGRDRSSGAQALAEAVLRALGRASDRWASEGATPQLRERVRGTAQALDRVQPAMGIFRRWSDDWETFARTGALGGLSSALRRWSGRWQAQLDREGPRLVAVARRRLRPGIAVLTLSRSSSVRRLLLAVPRSRAPASVVVLESLPGGEGRTLARELKRGGLTVRWVPDSAGLKELERADLLLLGADAVYRSGSVVHKVGTRSLALAAHERGVPVVVAAGSSKFVGRARPSGPLPSWFDLTPARAVTEFWTDRGVLSPREVRRRFPTPP